MLALMRDGIISGIVAEGDAFMHEEMNDGVVVFARSGPAVAGWVYGEYDLRTIVEQTIPEGHRIVSSDVQLQDGVPHRTYVTEPVPVEYPQITARQLRLALLSIDLHEADVDMLLVKDPAGMVEWKYANSYKRDHPLVNQLGAAKGLLPEHIDSMWIWASEL